MQEASDSYILSLVDVEASTWLILLATFFLNLARVKAWQVLAIVLEGRTMIAGINSSSYEYSETSDLQDEYQGMWYTGIPAGLQTNPLVSDPGQTLSIPRR